MDICNIINESYDNTLEERLSLVDGMDTELIELVSMYRYFYEYVDVFVKEDQSRLLNQRVTCFLIIYGDVLDDKGLDNIITKRERLYALMKAVERELDSIYKEIEEI